MKLVFGLIFVVAIIAACMLTCITSLYAVDALAAAQTVRSIPFVGPHVSERIEVWVLGAQEELVADTAPLYTTGTPLAITVTPFPVTPQPGDPNCGKPYVFPVEGQSCRASVGAAARSTQPSASSTLASTSRL